MIWYRLRYKTPSDWQKNWADDDGNVFFIKDRNTQTVINVYTTIEAAQRAKKQINGAPWDKGGPLPCEKYGNCVEIVGYNVDGPYKSVVEKD